MPTVLITGANRGLGLAFAEGYAARGWRVIATCRDPAGAAAPNGLAGAHPTLVTVERLDVTNDASVAACAARHAGEPIDVLLNNAGIYGTLAKQTWGSLDFAELDRVFAINTAGPLRVTQAFLDNVAASDQKKIISLGGGMGAQSIGSQFPGHYFMKMSKAAHLMAMGVLQHEVAGRGIAVVMFSPGRVDTQLMRDSGWTGASITPAASAARVMALIDTLTPAMHGRLVNFDGTLIPW